MLEEIVANWNSLPRLDNGPLYALLRAVEQ
jgi:hypothetical protein